jgi:cell division protein FtsL
MKSNRNQWNQVRRSRNTQRKWARAALVCLFLFLAMMVFVWKQIKINQLAKEINALIRRKEQLVNENKTLQLDIASMSQLSRIGRIASQKIGMQYPDQYPIVFKLIPSEKETPTTVPSLAWNRIQTGLDHVKSLLLPTAEAGSSPRE